MRRLGPVFSLTLAIMLGCATLAWAQSEDPDASGVEAGDPIPGSYIVSLEDRVTDPAAVARDLSGELGLKTDDVYESALEGFAAKVPTGELAELRADPRVEAVVRDRVVEATNQERREPTWGGQSPPPRDTGQKPPTGIRRVVADLSSTRAGNGSGRVDADIAILDSGIYKGHEDLNIAGGVNCVGDNRSAWSDPSGHGTHVAGTAAAKDNRIGVVGVAPGARLWAVRVLPKSLSGKLSDVICGVDWVTARADTIEVANMSLASEPGEEVDDDGNCGETIYDPLHQAVCRSVNKENVFYVVAAGNDSINFARTIPATYDETLTATSMADADGKPWGRERFCLGDRDDKATFISNFATPGTPDAKHTISAPGACIRSTWKNDGYRLDDGTSMAAPHVAGAAALCIAQGPCPAKKPQATMDRLLRDAKARPRSYGFKGDPRDPIGNRYYGYLLYAGGY